MSTPDHDLNVPAPEPLLRLGDGDRSRLAEALQELLAHGSILGLESGSLPLYTWCRQNFDWLRETAALAGLEIALLHEERIVQAIPLALQHIRRCERIENDNPRWQRLPVKKT